eukprot:gb/GEZN01015845.1/.p1 GENE.gb/GEZN01015845.1/~~gb/GEZN01015845.1/.p1  ORF type:complete len:278 (+),score=34.44 gb/GEZN01015845.1/:116-835(+)
MDCEMVGVGPDGVRSALARCSIVDWHGKVLYDRYVRPREQITDYRTHVSGIGPKHMTKAHGAIQFQQAQKEIHEILKDKVIVGHALKNDLDALLLSHPKHCLRDTAKCKLICPARPRKLSHIVQETLHKTIQVGKHDSVEDARAALEVYQSYRKRWEEDIHRKKFKRPAITKQKDTVGAFGATTGTAACKSKHKILETTARTEVKRQAKSEQRTHKTTKRRGLKDIVETPRVHYKKTRQ